MNTIERIKSFLKLKPFIREEVNRISNEIEFRHRADEMTRYSLTSKERGTSDERYCERDVIVSLTTFGRRIHDVHLSIESIMQGSIKPNKIILNIDESFKGKRLPRTLLNQQNRGLEINYCKDIRSYTKLIPTLREYPDAVIITIDDDLIYYYDVVEKLVNAYINEPDIIHANRIHRIVLDETSKPVSYMKWNLCDSPSDISHLNFLTGVGGVLYPPHCFDDEVFNESVFLDICKYADDIWFWAMALKNEVGIKKTYTHTISGEDYWLNEELQSDGLLVKNFNENDCRNDTQIKAVMDKYKLYEKLI